MSEELNLEHEQPTEVARPERPTKTCAKTGPDCKGTACISHNGGRDWFCAGHDPEAKAREERIAKYEAQAKVRP